MPEAPSLTRQVFERLGVNNGANDTITFDNPRLPPLHTTADGRVAVDIRSHGPDLDWFLFVPEKLSTHFIDLPKPESRAAILADHNAGTTKKFTTPAIAFETLIDTDSANTVGAGALRHVTIIDKTREFSAQSGSYTNNPYNVGGNDVYDIIVESTAEYASGPQANKLRHQFTPVRITVANPKTASAYILSIQIGDVTIYGGTAINTLTGPAHKNPVVTGAGNENKSLASGYYAVAGLLETKFTKDGKLLVGRIGMKDHTFYDPRNGNSRTEYADVVYAYSKSGFSTPDGVSGDNVDGFDNMIPVSMAAYDPRINGVLKATDSNYDFYGIAAFPMRDGFGTLIPPGEDVGASYPWMDSDGANLAFTTIVSRLHNGGTPGVGGYNPRYLNDTPPGVTTPSYSEVVNPFMGVSVVGLWTQGKIVTMDNRLNNTDFGLGQELSGHRLVHLYLPNVAGLPIQDGRIQVGSGRFNSNSPEPDGDVGNSAFFESIENRLNYSEKLRPAVPRDVAWWVSNGRSTDQFAFDEYLNPNSFILSKMNGALEWSLNPLTSSRKDLKHHDGWNETAGAFTDDPRVANDATAVSAKWIIPASGVMKGTGVRIEPIAHGGIEGKGAWLDSANGIAYEILAQPTAVASSPWYVGVFVDSRVDDIVERSLVTFPDNSSITLTGRTTLRYRNTSGTEVAAFSLPGTWNRNAWAHLGFQIHAGGQTVDFYHNGALARMTTSATPIFQLNPGSLTLGKVEGAALNGYRGWFDDFVVFAEFVNPEVAANHARGTLVGVNAGGNATLISRAGLYPSAQASIDDDLYHYGQTRFAYYAVHYDYSNEYGAHLKNIPSGATSIRESILHPEAPLFHNAPRPFTAQNSFCLSCHSDSNPWAAMKTSALTLNAAINARDDFRRMPVAPLRRVFGNVPANWITETGTPLPAVGGPTTNDGLVMDDWILRAAAPGQRAVNTLSVAVETTPDFWHAVYRLNPAAVGDGFSTGTVSLTNQAIRANLDASQGSVEFRLFDTATQLELTAYRRVDNTAPFVYQPAGAGVPPGNYDIQATPWGGANASGASGTSLRVNGVAFTNGSGGPTVILSESFNTNLGSWTAGGIDAFFAASSPLGTGGAANLQDNVDPDSAITTGNLALSGYTQVTVTFDFRTVGFGTSTEDFMLQVSVNGSAFTTVKSWNYRPTGTPGANEFINDTSYLGKSVVLTNATLSSLGLGAFSNTTRFRFICDAGSNADDLFLDNIVIVAQ